MWLFLCFDFERSYNVLKSKIRCIFLNKNINFNKNKMELKIENPTLCFSSYKNRKLKIKLWWVRARERKKRAFFVSFILSEGNFFNICVLSQSFAYQKTYFTHFCCLFLRSSKCFSEEHFEEHLEEYPWRTLCFFLGIHV